MKNYNFRSLTPLLGIVILVIIIWQVDIHQLLQILQFSDFSKLAVATLISLSTILFMNWRWQVILRASKIKLGFARTLPLVTKGIALGVLTPGKLGELYRAKYLRDASGINLGTAFSTVIIDRIFDLITLLGLGIISSTILFSIYIIDLPYSFIVFFSLIFVAVIILILHQSSAKKLIFPIFKILAPKNEKERAEFHFEKFYHGLKQINYKIWIFGLLATIAVWLINFFTFYLIGSAIGLSVPFIYIALISPVMILINLIPISVSGLGTTQATSIYLLGLRGVEAEPAIAFSFLLIFISIWLFALPGIILIIFTNNKK